MENLLAIHGGFWMKRWRSKYWWLEGLKNFTKISMLHSSPFAEIRPKQPKGNKEHREPVHPMLTRSKVKVPYFVQLPLSPKSPRQKSSPLNTERFKKRTIPPKNWLEILRPRR